MVWPFSRKSRKLELPPAEDHRWDVVQVDDGGSALVVRFNETAGEWAGHRDLPVKLGFAIPFKRPNEGGLPDAGESAGLGPIEDLIIREVSAATRGVYALTLTTGVMREFVFYIARGADIAKLHEDIRSRSPSYDVQCVAVEERKWESYCAFAP